MLNMKDEKAIPVIRVRKSYRALIDNMAHKLCVVRVLRREGGRGGVSGLNDYRIEVYTPLTLVMQTSFCDTFASSSASQVAGQRSL